MDNLVNKVFLKVRITHNLRIHNIIDNVSVSGSLNLLRCHKTFLF